MADTSIVGDQRGTPLESTVNEDAGNDEMDTSPSPPPAASDETITKQLANSTRETTGAAGNVDATAVTNGMILGPEVTVQPPPLTTEAALRNLELDKYWMAVNTNKQDFDAWTYLLQYVEEKADVIEQKKAFDEFFLFYPYCYGYWKKYADILDQKMGTTEAMQVYERSLAAIPLSVDLWINYIDFMIELKPAEEEIRKLFIRAISACGMDFQSDKLWDKYIDYEAKMGQLCNITQIYKQLINMPTQCYSHHYDNLKMHIDKHDPSAILSNEELQEARKKAAEAQLEVERQTGEDEIPIPKPNLEGEMAESEIQGVRVVLYNTFHSCYSKNEAEVAKRWAFEEAIRRPYFHVKPLDKAQLQNWREYIDFEMKHGTVDQAVVLFERCLIACAMYEEFWLKYTSYLEQLKQLEAAREVFRRACTHHLPLKASIHISWAFFEERIGNFAGASDVMNLIETKAPGNMCVMNHRLNLLRRHGDDLHDIYMGYINQENMSVESATLLTCKYSRHIHKIKNDKLGAVKLLKDRIKVDPTGELIYTTLLDMEYQQTPINEMAVLRVFDMVERSAFLSAESKEKFASRRYEFIDDFGTDVNRLYSAYQAQELLGSEAESRKRIGDEPAEDESEAKKTKSDVPVTTTASNGSTQTAKPADSTAQSYDYYSQQQQSSWSDYYQQQGYGYDASTYYNQGQWGSYTGTGYNY